MGNIAWSSQPWYQNEISIAAAHGIPTAIVDAVIQMESGGKSVTNSIGATGLLQLLPNGGQGSGYTNAQLLDPVTNLQIGIPYLANAYKAMPAFDNSYNWWYNFGLKSGHVGVAGSEQASAATAMQNAYNGNLTGGTAGATALAQKMVDWVNTMFAGSVQKYGQGCDANGQNCEQGFDYGATMNTPIPTVYGGKVVFAGKTDWGGGSTSGGIVVIQTVVAGVTNYFYQLHLNSANVKAGDIVNPGDIIGMSGGQTSGGNWNTDPQFTSGPHGEVGFNATFLNIGNVGAALKAQGITVPAGFNPINDLTNVADIAASAGGSSTNTSGGNQTTPPPAKTGTCAPWDVTCIINSVFTSDFFQRFGLIFIALVIILVGVLILFFSHPQAVQAAATAAA